MTDLEQVIDVSGGPSADSTAEITLNINGASHTLHIEPRVSLLDALRERLDLTGTKKGCNQGACGACTVLANGERILSCLALAVQYTGAAITTIEGLSAGFGPDGLGTDVFGKAGLSKAGALHPVQAAFVDEDGFQCGYCTPGQICSAVGMIREFRSGSPSAVTPDMSATEIVFSDEEIKERMSGNLCRCGAYVGICDAIRDAWQAGVAR